MATAYRALRQATFNGAGLRFDVRANLARIPERVIRCDAVWPMTAVGQKRKSRSAKAMSGLPPIADIAIEITEVR